MSEDELNSAGLNRADQELEAALRSLAPATPRINPVAAAFEAGRRSSWRQVRVWQAAAAVLVLVGAGTWFMPLSHEQPGPLRGPDSTIAVNDTTTPRVITDHSLIMLRAAVAEHGLDGLPRVELPTTEPMWAGGAIQTRGKP